MLFSCVVLNGGGVMAKLPGGRKLCKTCGFHCMLTRGGVVTHPPVGRKCSKTIGFHCILKSGGVMTHMPGCRKSGSTTHLQLPISTAVVIWVVPLAVKNYIKPMSFLLLSAVGCC